MRKIFTLVLALGLLAGTALSASAAGDVTLIVDPEPTVTAGNDISISLSSTTDDGNWLQVDVCYQLEEGAPVLTLPVATAECRATPATGGWVQLKQVRPSDGPLETVFETEGLAGRTVGIRGQHVPVQGNPLGIAYQDVEIVAPSGGDAARHAGCNGIENAITKVKPNGNAKQKLDALAEQFKCDVE